MEKKTIQTSSNQQLERWIAESHIKEDSLNKSMSQMDKMVHTMTKTLKSMKTPLQKAISKIMLNRNEMIEELSKRDNEKDK